MFKPILEIRRPLECDKARAMFKATPHIVIFGAFGWRVLVTRYGPTWWAFVMRPVLIKYRLQMALGRLRS